MEVGRDTQNGPSSRVAFIATWAGACALGAAAATLVTFGSIGYLLASPLLGQLILWTLVGLAQVGTLRLFRVESRALMLLVVSWTVAGIAFSLLLFGAIPALRSVLSALVSGTIVIATFVGVAHGMALGDRRARGGASVVEHSATSAVGAMLGTATSLLLVATIGYDPNSTVSVIAVVGSAAATGAAVYGALTGWSVWRMTRR